MNKLLQTPSTNSLLKKYRKQGIDKSSIEDPLERVSTKMPNSKLKFKLKKFSENDVEKTLKQIKKKKSSGYDGLTQDKNEW